uniref:Uncharacterized protein n=1 Tax=Heterorhabditis bacteriophora TaxID=37862 RepID=A0A1I7WA95_HETBA
MSIHLCKINHSTTVTQINYIFKVFSLIILNICNNKLHILQC